MKRLLLVRHAECDMNLRTKGTIGGQSNASPLTTLGRQQAAALGRYLAATQPCVTQHMHASSSRTAHHHHHHQQQQQQQQLVFSSTAVRALDTAAIMLQQLPAPAQQPAVVSTDALLELSQGSWEGQPRAACYTPDVLARIAADPINFAAPGGESQRQLEARVAGYLRGVVLPALQCGGPPALVVTHGLAIKCFLRHVLDSSPGMTWKVQLDNTSVTQVAWCEGGPAAGWHLGCVNDCSHLALAGLHPLQLQAAAAAAAGGAGADAGTGADAVGAGDSGAAG